MYLLGLVSEVYRDTARTKLNIFSKFHNTMAKLMIAEVAFRGMVGKWDGRTRDLCSLSPRMLHERLQDIFGEATHLGQTELMKMASVIFTSMDKDRSGQINCAEFIQSCTNDGEISLDRMAHFFDADQPKQFLRRLFDNTHREANKVAGRTMGGFSFQSPTSSEDYGDAGNGIEIGCGDVLDLDSMVETLGEATIPSAPAPTIRASLSTNNDMWASHESTLVRLEKRTKELDILATHESTLALSVLRLEKRMRKLELHWERAHESTSVRLEKQMQGLELYCERALHALRVRIAIEPPQTAVQQVSRNRVCPVLSSRAGTSNSSGNELACDLATCDAPVPDQVPAQAITGRESTKCSVARSDAST
jgi:hypothetical protein